MSLLSMIQDATAELGLDRPTAVIADTSAQMRLFVRVANNEGRSLASRHDWQALTTETSFTTVAADSQTSSIPSDFDRILPETMFNRTTNRQVYGPLDVSEWQRIKSSLVTRVNPAFRIRGGSVLITPQPTAGDSVYYEYISTKWCESSGGTAQTVWTADTDTGKLNESIMTLGIVWRFLAAKKLDFQSQLADYERAVTDAILRDGSKRRLNLSEPNYDRVPTAPITPDTYVLT